MSIPIFTYGSLMFAPVWERVVTGNYCSATATLHDHARYAIHGEIYPGMVMQQAASVAGVLYFDVTADDIAALDAFEGRDYRRELCEVQLENGEMICAAAYRYLPVHRLSDSPWLPEAFQMQRFLQVYCQEPHISSTAA